MSRTALRLLLCFVIELGSCVGFYGSEHLSGEDSEPTAPDGDADADADSDGGDDVSDADFAVLGDSDRDVENDDDADPNECIANCAGRVCGDDGCGGQCGPGCPEGELCEPESGRCTDCVPGCSDGVCGPGEWATVCAGTFTMGLPPGGEGVISWVSNEAHHEVTLTRSFVILSREVTREEFQGVMGFDPTRSYLHCADQCPVENVSWHQAAGYCNALSQRERRPSCYTCVWTGTIADCVPSTEHVSPYECLGYRLPTEAEWEYAARATTTTTTYNGVLDNAACDSDVLDPIAWYCGNSERTDDYQVSPVGTRAPNLWGLHDMLGNVAEWCHDGYDADLGTAPVIDPVRPPTGDYRVRRGGTTASSALEVRASAREFRAHSLGPYYAGFRPVRTLHR